MPHQDCESARRAFRVQQMVDYQVLKEAPTTRTFGAKRRVSVMCKTDKLLWRIHARFFEIFDSIAQTNAFEPREHDLLAARHSQRL